MRCHRSLPSLVALLALFLLAAGAAQAQVTAGGDDIPKGTARLTASLSAGAELPGPGDPDLSGTADLVVNPRKGKVCFDVELDAASQGADTVVALHVHPGVSGEVCLVGLGQECPAPLDLDFGGEGLEGCAKKLPKQLLNAIVSEPEQFYLHVHTARFPAGAVRGQLEP